MVDDDWLLLLLLLLVLMLLFRWKWAKRPFVVFHHLVEFRFHTRKIIQYLTAISGWVIRIIDETVAGGGMSTMTSTNAGGFGTQQGFTRGDGLTKSRLMRGYLDHRWPILKDAIILSTICRVNIARFFVFFFVAI